MSHGNERRAQSTAGDAARPPSVDALARTLAATPAGGDLPHAILVEIARTAIADNAVADAPARAHAFARSLLTPVVNATGVLLHTNLGRAPVAVAQSAQAITVEFDLATGERGSRQRAVGQLFAQLCGAEAAIVVNNNAAAVMLVMAALASGRDVAVSRGESVEIGGSFRVPDVLAQSGARLVDVGTTNRTRLDDYRRAIVRPGTDIALVLKVHPSNYRVDGFVEETSIADLATLDVPVVADLGSGLLDAHVPWISGPPPAWLADEPAARQAVADGADIVTFSGDKLLGGPQAGIIVGRADLVERCARHPLARALRCGAMVLVALQEVALSYLRRTVTDDVAFWRMATTSTESLRARANALVQPLADTLGASVVDTDAVPGAGSVPGVTIPSVGLAIDGDQVAALRAHTPPVIARARKQGDRQVTILDLRSVEPADDGVIAHALASLAHGAGG